MSRNTASSPISPDSSSSDSVTAEELKSLIRVIPDSHVVLERIDVDSNGNVAKSSQILHIDSDDDFVSDKEVRNSQIYPIPIELLPPLKSR